MEIGKMQVLLEACMGLHVFQLKIWNDKCLCVHCYPPCTDLCGSRTAAPIPLWGLRSLPVVFWYLKKGEMDPIISTAYPTTRTVCLDYY